MKFLTVFALWSVCAGTLATAHPHRTPQDAGATPSTSPVTNVVIGGSGAFRYRYLPEKLALPPGVKMRNGHGLCHDADGNIYFCYEAEEINEATRTLVRFNPDGTGAVLLGKDNSLAKGVPHGLNIAREPDGQTVLYHANNEATVQKTTLSGDILWSQKWSPQMGNYKPTDVVVAPGTARVLVADGYGSSMVHALNTSDGVYAGKSWGGAGSSHGDFNCPHGIAFDPRRNLLLVADRGNHRLEYYTASGRYESTVQAPEITAPCNVDFLGDFALVPDLDGKLIILDKGNQAVSVIEIAKLLGSAGFNHPHDAIWLDNGDIVVCTWNPGRLAYWKKLPPQ